MPTMRLSYALIDNKHITLNYPSIMLHDNFCEICGDEVNVLGGTDDTGTHRMICTRCATKQSIDVCRGSCLKWKRLIKLNAEGVCSECERTL
jgi:hypothetical protein